MVFHRRAGRSALFIGLASVAAVLIILGVAAFVLRWRGAERRNEALIALSVAGEPVLPEELKRFNDGKPEGSAWLARVAALGGHFNLLDLSEPAENERWKERARSGEFGEAGRTAFDAFESCATKSVKDRTAFVTELSMLIGVGDGTVALSPCEAEAVRVMNVLSRAELAVARDAENAGSIDPQLVAHALLNSSEVFPHLPLGQLFALADATQIDVVRACIDEHPDEIVAALRTSRASSRIFDHSFLLVGAVASNLQLSSYLSALEFALPHLPRNTDLSAVAADLEALHPRERLVEALRGERTFGNARFEKLRVGKADPLETDNAGSALVLLPALTLGSDQAAYLDVFRAYIQAAGKPAFLRQFVAPQPNRVLEPFTAGMVPGLQNALLATDRLEARLVLARAALVAFTSGAQDALLWIGKSVDPYDGKPVRCALSNEGLILMWSVGADRVDDDGRDRTKDVVWKLRLR